MTSEELDFTSPPLLVSSLSVYLDSQSRKKIESVILDAGEITRTIYHAISPGGGHHEPFNPPLEILAGAKVSVSVRYRRIFKHGTISLFPNPQEILDQANEEEGKRLYRKTERNVEVVIGVQSLPSIVKEIVASCSRFRLLIIGDTGVGKSSLINKVFSVAGVDVSSTTRGEATIDWEYIASENTRLVVHDSRGFEAADTENLKTVHEFISGRKQMRDLKDQIHAVWLCLTIPYAGGRLLEAGVEEFLKNKNEILGDVPLVVVFTKLDILINKLKVEALEKEDPSDDIFLQGRKLESLDKLCSAPIRKAVGSDSISHVAVSTLEGYEESLSSLVDVTMKSIQTYVKDEAAHYIATIAQRVNITHKIASTITVGEKKYWKALMTSPNFRGHTIKACLDVIHQDIIAVWNLHDPDHNLEGHNFKALLLASPAHKVKEGKDLQKTVRSSVGLIAALVTIITTVAGTGGIALPIVVSAAAIAVLGKLSYELYKATQVVVKQLMAYIVDLTCLMQIIFLLVSTQNSAVNAEIIRIATEAYEQTHRGGIHEEISGFNVNFAVAPGKCDSVLEKIKELIRNHSIEDDALTKLREQLQ